MRPRSIELMETNIILLLKGGAEDIVWHYELGVQT